MFITSIHISLVRKHRFHVPQLVTPSVQYTSCRQWRLMGAVVLRLERTNIVGAGDVSRTPQQGKQNHHPPIWQSLLINFTIISVHPPLLVYQSNLEVSRRISSLPVCLHENLPNNGQTVRKRARGRERGGRESGHKGKQRKRSEGLWLSD